MTVASSRSLAAAILAMAASAALAADPAAPPATPATPAPATAGTPAAQPPAAGKPDAGDLARKAEIMYGPHWRRAVFELGHWLDSQEIYTPEQVARIKQDFNARVAKMSSYELEYLLDDLDEKFKVMDSPEAKEARAWVGQYLSVMSDRKRAEVLKDMPDVVTMSAGELEQEIKKIEEKRQSLASQQQAFNQSRQELVAAQQQSIRNTQRAAAAPLPGAAYSPYHGGGGGKAGGKQPFSDVKGSGMRVYTGGGFGGAGVSFNVGMF